jgi:hypothetical protein
VVGATTVRKEVEQRGAERTGTRSSTYARSPTFTGRKTGTGGPPRGRGFSLNEQELEEEDAALNAFLQDFGSQDDRD